jgi:hypothetical protein
MNCDVTLTANEFKDLHNALCELRGIVERMNHTMVKIESVQDVVSKMEYALQSAYTQDNDAFDRKYSHYRNVKEELGLDAIWSVYEVEDLNERHPFPSDAFVVYKDHWGEKPVHCAVYGSTWAAIYTAANACVRDSGDEHHVFIERFVLKNGNELHMTTGS